MHWLMDDKIWLQKGGGLSRRRIWYITLSDWWMFSSCAVLLIMVEQVWTRALYPRIVKERDVGCNTSLCTCTHTRTHTSVNPLNGFTTVTTHKDVQSSWGFAEMCSPWRAVEEASLWWLLIYRAKYQNTQGPVNVWVCACFGLGLGVGDGGGSPR